MATLEAIGGTARTSLEVVRGRAGGREGGGGRGNTWGASGGLSVGEAVGGDNGDRAGDRPLSATFLRLSTTPPPPLPPPPRACNRDTDGCASGCRCIPCSPSRVSLSVSVSVRVCPCLSAASLYHDKCMAARC